MRAVALRQLLREDLRHIPRGGYEQNELRMVYAIVRQHEFAEDARTPSAASLERAIDSVRQRHPTFTPLYDAAYFMGGSSR